MKEKPETKICKYCKTEIPYDAKICPNCRKKQGMSLILKILIALVVIGVLGGILGGGSNSSTSSSNTSSSTNTVVKEEAPIEYTVIDVGTMIDDLDNNALKAENTYDNQYLEITGKMNVIDSDGKYISLYDDGFSIIGVQCFIKNEDQKNYVMELSQGDTVTVRVKIKDVGEILGYQADIVEFVD